MCKELILVGESLSSWQRRATQATAKTRDRTSRMKNRIWTWKQFERTIMTRQHKNWTHRGIEGFLTGHNMIKCETIDTFSKIKISFYFCCFVIIFINFFKPMNLEEKWNGIWAEKQKEGSPSLKKNMKNKQRPLNFNWFSTSEHINY